MNNLRKTLGLHRPELARVPEPVPPRPQQPAKPKPGKPAVVATETLIAACGHTTVFELFDDKKDKFREQRRANKAAKICPQCRAAKDEAIQAAARERRRLKKQELKNRLPNGSIVQAMYDADAARWSGCLSIQGTTYSGQASGLFKLLRQLDQQYRQTMNEKPDCTTTQAGG